MRINDRELIFTSSLQSDREGRLNYKSPNSRREGTVCDYAIYLILWVCFRSQF